MLKAGDARGIFPVLRGTEELSTVYECEHLLRQKRRDVPQEHLELLAKLPSETYVDEQDDRGEIGYVHRIPTKRSNATVRSSASRELWRRNWRLQLLLALAMAIVLVLALRQLI
jgi:hypothetical protein